MKKFTSYALMALLFLSAVGFAKAEEGVQASFTGSAETATGATEVKAKVDASTGIKKVNTKPSPKVLPPIKRSNIEERQEIKASTTNQIKVIRDSMKDIRGEAKGEIKDMRQDTKEKIQGMRTDLASSTKQRMEEMREKIGERKVEIANKMIDNRFAQMNRRFEATIERLTNIMTRVEARIVKVKAAQKDTSVAEKLVADAKTQLDLAKAALLKLQTASETTITFEATASTTAIRKQAKDALSGMQKIAKELEGNLRSAHMSLEKAVASLRMGVKGNATTTPVTNSNEQ